MNRARPTPQRLRLDDMPCFHPNAAGLDIGARAIVVAVPPARDAEPVRVFATFTPDLRALVDWLVQGGIDTVAMASTGVYWRPVFARLEPRGIHPYLVNARQIKTGPGRKRDWNDAQWRQKRQALGVLQGAFRPDAEMGVWRTRLRHRATLIAHRAPHLLHRQKALNLMHIQLNEVLTEITGVTGQAILCAILNGERDPLTLAQWRNPACKSSEDASANALTGTWRDEPWCILQQALALFDCSTHQLAACKAQIERQFAAMKPRFASDEPPVPLPRVKPGSKSKNQPRDDARAHLARITGVDVGAITGISASIAQTIISEIGTDRRKFPTVNHCCSWLGLAPHHDLSGGRVWRSRTRKVVSQATQAFRQAAQAVARSDSAVGAYFRAMRARLGPQQATVATAHKIARVVYHLLKHREAFTAESAAAYTRQRRERELKPLTRRANKRGDRLTPVAASQPAPAL